MPVSYALRRKIFVTITVALATLFLGGCASAPWGDGASATAAETSEIELQKAELARMAEALAAEKAELEAEKQRLAAERSEQMQPESASEASRAVNRGSIPPDAKPGECYARVIIPAQYQAVNERLPISKEFERIELIPARYEIVDETVVIKEAQKRLEVVPAEYETVTERIMVEPETTKLEVVPATYKEIEERRVIEPEKQITEVIPAKYEFVEKQVLVQEARQEWKRGEDIGVGGNVSLASAKQTFERYGDYTILKTRIKDTGELMCLVEIPAVYKTIKEKILVEKAETRVTEIIPAVYETIKKTVEATPATTREITIPAKYRDVQVTRLVTPEHTREITIPEVTDTIKVRKLVQEAKVRTETIPPEYTTVTKNVMTSPEDSEWRPVLCEVNMTRENVGALQSALNDAGACRCGPSRNACDIDGIMGPCTLNAVERYAKRENLSWGSNYVTIDVIRALGLDFASN